MPERAIVNFGVYQFSPEEREAFRLRVYTQVEREPETPYKNFKYQKPQSFYGYAQLMFGEWVQASIPLEYGQQLLYEYTNNLAQIAILVYCSTKQTRDNILSLATCIPACVLEPVDPGVTGLWRVPIDRIVFKLIGTTTVLVNTDIQQFDNVCAVPLQWADDGYLPPGASSTDVPMNPEDEPYDIPSPPYDIPSADNGETYNPQRPEEGEGTPGTLYDILVSASAFDLRANATVVANNFGGQVTAPYFPYTTFQGRLDSNTIYQWGIEIQHAGGLLTINMFSNGTENDKLIDFTITAFSATPRP